MYSVSRQGVNSALPKHMDRFAGTQSLENRSGFDKLRLTLLTFAWPAQGWVMSSLITTRASTESDALWVAPWLLLSVLSVVVASSSGFWPLRRKARDLYSALGAGWEAAAFGGLGMVIGGWIDLQYGGAGHHCHVEAPMSGLWSWMTLFMVVACLPCCFKSRDERMFSILGKAIVTMISMVVGMLLGGALLPRWLYLISDSSTWVGHVAMVVGMGCGTAVASLFTHRKEVRSCQRIEN